MSLNNIKKGMPYICIILIIPAIVIVTHALKATLGIERDSALSLAMSLVESVGLLVTTIVAAKQLIILKETAVATFITELNQSFVSNEEYHKIYDSLQMCHDNVCPYKDECSKDGVCRLKVSKGSISNYLTFFETINLLRKKGVIDFDILNDLFSYRFFLAVHSKLFQQEKLGVQPKNFKNIFNLEYDWLNWRIKNKIRVDGVYGTRRLEDLMEDKKEYLELVK